jgi:hypothetical protein
MPYYQMPNFIVMPGLDPVIHAVPKLPMPDHRANGDAWMTGSSPVMTK